MIGSCARSIPPEWLFPRAKADERPPQQDPKRRRNLIRRQNVVDTAGPDRRQGHTREAARRRHLHDRMPAGPAYLDDSARPIRQSPAQDDGKGAFPVAGRR